ncbi:MAG: SAM-dependent methyltransferase [Alphaproteobacteria bacterium]|nr:SAM-dependent methyltransferase [Alphaproteobacteria bacterium]
MQEKQPSRTARRAAVHRAVHQKLENGSIFSDPLAAVVLDEQDMATTEREVSDPTERPLRLFMAARSRFAEDSLAAAVARGVRQAVILGAGLDTFALRNPHADIGLRVFETDQPDTQAWKRERLAQARLKVPLSLTFVPLDFELDKLASRLPAAGFEPNQSAFFIWLGVVPYLTRRAIAETLGFIASVPDAEVVFDYAEPIENYPPERQTYVERTKARVAAIGEPWLSLFDPTALANELGALGFNRREDLGPKELADRFYGVHGVAVKDGAGVHVIHARRE